MAKKIRSIVLHLTITLKQMSKGFRKLDSIVADSYAMERKWGNLELPTSKDFATLMDSEASSGGKNSSGETHTLRRPRGPLKKRSRIAPKTETFGKR